MYCLLALLFIILIIYYFSPNQPGSERYQSGILNKYKNKKRFLPKKPREHFNIPKPVTSEYVPQNMTIQEFKTINRWDYPGYLNNTSGSENFGNYYPGGREDVDCLAESTLDSCSIMSDYV